MTDGNILYVSESVTSLLEHLPVGPAGLLCPCFYSPTRLTSAVSLCAPQTDLVDQNLLNFLPIGEHSDVYKALSTHPSDPESLNTDFMKSKSCPLTRRPRLPVSGS